MASGWVRIERDVFDHGFFASEPMSEREAYIWMIARAAWRDTRHRIRGKMHHVPRGSFFVTQRELLGIWRWRSLSRIQKFLNRLEEAEMIAISVVSGKTLITICSYDEYQDRSPAPNTKQRQQEREAEPRQEPEAAESAPEIIKFPAAITDRERLLAAVGHDVSGTASSGDHGPGNNQDMLEAGRWRDELGLSLDEQIAVIEDVTNARRGSDPPNSFKFFTKAMQRFAGAKARPALTPTQGATCDGNNAQDGRQERRINSADRAFNNLAASFARTISGEPKGSGGNAEGAGAAGHESRPGVDRAAGGDAPGPLLHLGNTPGGHGDNGQ